MTQSKLRRNKQGFMEDEDERLKKEREKLLAKRSNSDVPNQEPQRNDWIYDLQRLLDERPAAKEPAIEEPAAQEARVDKTKRIQPIATEEEDGGIIPYSSDDSLGENLLKIPFNAIVDLPSHLVGWAEDIKYLVETGSDLLSDPKTAPEKIENKFNETVSSADEFIGTVVREFGPELAAEIGEDLLEDITDNPLDYMEWFIPGLAAKKGFKAVEGPKKLKGLTKYVKDTARKVKARAEKRIGGPPRDISPEAQAKIDAVNSEAKDTKNLQRSLTGGEVLENANRGADANAQKKTGKIAQKDLLEQHGSHENRPINQQVAQEPTDRQRKTKKAIQGTDTYKTMESRKNLSIKFWKTLFGGATAYSAGSALKEGLEDRYIKDPLKESIDEETEEQREKFDRSRDLRTGHEARKEDIEKDKRRRIAKKGAKLTKD